MRGIAYQTVAVNASAILGKLKKATNNSFIFLVLLHSTSHSDFLFIISHSYYQEHEFEKDAMMNDSLATSILPNYNEITNSPIHCLEA